MVARRRSPRLALASIAAAVALALVAPAPAAAAGFIVRLEAGPHTGVTFDPAWQVLSRRTVSLTAPLTVTASARSARPAEGTWLRLTAGVLAGRWVRESTVAYVPGIVGATTFVPWRTATLRAGSWELYRFDAAGTMTEARGRTLLAATNERLDRAAVIRGRRHVRIASGTWAGWWLPGSAAAPIPIVCSAGSPPTGRGPITVRSVPAATGEIALTFDLGGRTAPALAILRYLVLERVCATIFPTGATAATADGHAVLAEVRAHPELFELGNHTQHHCNLRDGGGGAACPATRPTAAYVEAELQQADAVISAIAGRHTNPYWRPPYGAVDAGVRQAAADAGWGYTVMWTTDTIDWRPRSDGGPSAAEVATKVIAGRMAGGVVLMHLGGYPTRDALPAMVAGLRSAGYTPTTVSDLFR